MLHVNVEELMKQGHSPEEIVKMVSDEIHAKAEQEAARIAAEKKAKAAEEAKKASQRKADARAAAVAALSDYFTLVLPHGKEVDMKGIVNEALDSLEETIQLMNNVTVRYNGKSFNIFDL
jgi:membrane protein involved in colicin uptake